jgi:hypothetical protein
LKENGSKKEDLGMLQFNELTKSVSEAEGKKEEQNIAQINETTKIVLEHLAEAFMLDPYDTIEFLKGYTPELRKET